MIIKSVEILGLRGFNFKIRFWRGINVLVGLNGCGKTTVLQTIAGLAGADIATELLMNKEFHYLRIVVVDEGKIKELEVHGHWGHVERRERIMDFKSQLAHRASFVLTHDLDEARMVTERREPVACQEDMLAFLERVDLKLNLHAEGNKLTFYVPETGGLRYLLTAGMRRSPENVPSLIENPERHLHIMLGRLISSYYQASDRHQLIMTSHGPEVVASTKTYLKGEEFKKRHNMAKDLYFGIIDLTNDRYKWLGYRYD